jgi:uracil-DNA glycosylase
MMFIQEKSWFQALEKEVEKHYFKELMSFLDNEYKEKPATIFPAQNEIFRALELCPLTNVQVVILGQDPYPTRGHAHGLCFSVEDSVRPFPKSLQNVFKEIEQDLGVPYPENGNLERWAKQGVLLLNTVLTVQEGQPESHSKIGWEKFTDAVIKQLALHQEGVVYLLWGKKAEEKAKVVNASRNLVLTAPHPSPLSAYRGFLGCGHFSKANSYLEGLGRKPIAW